MHVFKSKMNKLCDNVPVVLTSNNIDFVHETKYLGMIINSSMKTSSDVCQTRKFYVSANMNDYTTSCSVKKLKTSYNSALCNLILIKKNFVV